MSQGLWGLAALGAVDVVVFGEDVEAGIVCWVTISQASPASQPPPLLGNELSLGIWGLHPGGCASPRPCPMLSHRHWLSSVSEAISCASLYVALISNSLNVEM